MKIIKNNMILLRYLNRDNYLCHPHLKYYVIPRIQPKKLTWSKNTTHIVKI